MNRFEVRLLHFLQSDGYRGRDDFTWLGEYEEEYANILWIEEQQLEDLLS